MFWDGDPTKQSFISVVGLSTPRVSRTRSRPSSAPAQTAQTSRLNSPRVHQNNATDATELSGLEVGGWQTWSGRQYIETERRINTTREGEVSIEMGRVLVLEHRLNELMRENACMRDAMLNKLDESRLERLAQAQRRNHELIAALQTAKEGAEGKARRTQERVRALQIQLRKKTSQQEPSPVTQQRSPSCSEDRLAESRASISTPASAPQWRCQSKSDNHLPAAGVLTTLTTVGNNVTPSTTQSFTRATRPGGKRKTFGGAAATTITTAGNGKDDELGSPRGSNLECHEHFVVSRPETKTIARRIPSPKKWPNVSAAAGKSVSSPADVSASAATLNGGTFSKQQVAAVDHGLQEEKQCPRKHVHTVARNDAGNIGGGSRGVDNARSGGRGNSHGTAPKVLLARGLEAALRREERAAAAREKDEQEIRLSSSFRAKELHPTSGPDWATIKAHQDIVRKQRTRDRAAFLAATSSLPARMARHAAMQAVAEDRAGSKGSCGGAVGCTSSDHQGRGVTGNRIEEPEDIGRVMQRRQEKWEASLAAAKASSRTAATRPRTPPMEKRRLAQEAKRKAREKAERIAREAAARRRVEEEKRHFQQRVAMHRNNGNTFRETRNSVRKAEETRLKIQQGLQREEREREEEMAKEARRREVSRAVREYVLASEARRREEHGAGPPLEELTKKKKDEKNAEFRERQRRNRSGLHQALRKRPNLLERQEKYAQQHSKRLADQASAARDFLEGSEGFHAAGRRALRAEAEAGWMARAVADDTFSSKEKAELGLVPAAVVLDGNDPR
ncbi:unnamed protein product, partial [Pylaiella littoralis]